MSLSLIIAAGMTILLLSVCRADSAVSAMQQDDQTYTVLPGDTLYAIADRLLNDPTLYGEIVSATNARAATDAQFATIEDPRLIRVGQRLYIPTDAMPPTAPVSASTQQSEPLSPTVPADTQRSVRFVQPVDGAVVPPTFTVAMTATGLVVEPAGDIREGAGHFHILLDTDFMEPGELIPFDTDHLHFGQGQLTTTIALPPGEHVLRLQFANGAHLTLDGPQYRDEITVTVEGDAGAADIASRTAEEPGASTTSAATVESEVEPEIHFVRPVDGAVVPPTFTVAMTATGLVVEPAGDIREGAGHFHILLDTDFVAPGELVPFDENHLHFGQGQLTTTIALPPGEHVLRLQFANGAHLTLDGPQYRDEITIVVDADAPPDAGARIEQDPRRSRFKRMNARTLDIDLGLRESASTTMTEIRRGRREMAVSRGRSASSHAQSYGCNVRLSPVTLSRPHVMGRYSTSRWGSIRSS